MLEYQAEIITRNSYNFESAIFSADSICFDNPDVDPDYGIEPEFPVDPFNNADVELQLQLISPCSYLSQFYSSTSQLMNDLFIHSVDSRVGF